MGDDDGQYDTSRLGDDGGTSSSDPNTNDARCNGMDATNLANNPSNMANTMLPNEAPRTSHKSLVDRYILVQ